VTAQSKFLAREAELHHLAETTGADYLWFWEAETYTLVLGRSSDLAKDAADRFDIPIVRRESGGGTVLLGPGCLNYTLVLSYDRHPQLRHITDSYQSILTRVADALALPAIELQGTDLTLRNRKFAGCGQRRRRHTMLHHGTILHNFDLPKIAQFLREPDRQPAYRRRRSHAAFLTNVTLHPDFRSRLAARFPSATLIP
jgi:lipoate-protein ligase A